MDNINPKTIEGAFYIIIVIVGIFLVSIWVIAGNLTSIANAIICSLDNLNTKKQRHERYIIYYEYDEKNNRKLKEVVINLEHITKFEISITENDTIKESTIVVKFFTSENKDIYCISQKLFGIEGRDYNTFVEATECFISSRIKDILKGDYFEFSIHGNNVFYFHNWFYSKSHISLLDAFEKHKKSENSVG